MNSFEVGHVSEISHDEIFSIIIPSWNNLNYLKLCIDSILKNSKYKHQIIVHVNEGSDGTMEWLNQEKHISYTFSNSNVGVCYSMNFAAQLARANYIVYINDDMYVCPDWDHYLYESIKAIGHKNFYISGTMIEAKPQSKCSIQGDYGKGPEDFREQALLKEFNTIPFHDWNGATWPPSVVHRDLWNLSGGLSIEFSPGFYSDPDFSMKLWRLGVRYFKGVSNSRVYHFGSVSTKKIKDQKAYYRFIAKWGLTAGSFSKIYLRRGTKFKGALPNPRIPISLKVKNLIKKVQFLYKDLS